MRKYKSTKVQKYRKIKKKCKKHKTYKKNELKVWTLHFALVLLSIEGDSYCRRNNCGQGTGYETVAKILIET